MFVKRLEAIAGAGKTSFILKEAVEAFERYGRDFSSIGLATYTRAARQEALDRVSAAWDVPASLISKEGNFGTLSSAAFRNLGPELGKQRQVIDGAKKEHRDWLAEVVGASVGWVLPGNDAATAIAGDAGLALSIWSRVRNIGGLLSAEAQRARSLGLVPFEDNELWKFVDHYERAKKRDGFVDFTDLLLLYAGVMHDPAGGPVSVTPLGDVPDVNCYFFDEHQDVSPLADQVARRLASGPRCEYVVIAGDPGQAIYGFLGADPSCFRRWNVDKEEQLFRSYRCPQVVVDIAERCLGSQSDHALREVVGLGDPEGSMVSVHGMNSFAIREFFIKQFMQMNPGESWLFLTRTNQHVPKWRDVLTEFNRPHLTLGATGTAANKRAFASLYRLSVGEGISGEQMTEVMKEMRSTLVDASPLPEPTIMDPKPERGKIRLLAHGAKAAFARDKPLDVYFLSDLPSVGVTQEACQRIGSGRLNALVNDSSEFTEAVSLYGIEEFESPNVRVGTVHSAKGMEADNVVLLAQTSSVVAEAAREQSVWDEECRLSYVALTRAKKRAFVVDNRSPRQNEDLDRVMSGLESLLHPRRESVIQGEVAHV